MHRRNAQRLATLLATLVFTAAPGACTRKNDAPVSDDLWSVYERHFVAAKYVDLTHPFEPNQAVWPGFGRATFAPAAAGVTMDGYVDV